MHDPIHSVGMFFYRLTEEQQRPATLYVSPVSVVANTIRFIANTILTVLSALFYVATCCSEDMRKKIEPIIERAGKNTVIAFGQSGWSALNIATIGAFGRFAPRIHETEMNGNGNSPPELLPSAFKMIADLF